MSACRRVLDTWLRVWSSGRILDVIIQNRSRAKIILNSLPQTLNHIVYLHPPPQLQSPPQSPPPQLPPQSPQFPPHPPVMWFMRFCISSLVASLDSMTDPIKCNSLPASGWLRSTLTLSEPISNTLPRKRWPFSFCSGMMASTKMCSSSSLPSM